LLNFSSNNFLTIHSFTAIKTPVTRAVKTSVKDQLCNSNRGSR